MDTEPAIVKVDDIRERHMSTEAYTTIKIPASTGDKGEVMLRTKVHISAGSNVLPL